MSDTTNLLHPALAERNGSWPVMLTPYDAQKNIDWLAFEKLVEWYIAAGSQGLFAVCLSSELYHLTPEERLQLATRTVQISNNRVPVIAGGALGNSTAEIAEAAKKLAGSGITALIFLSNQFAKENESDDVWISNAEAVLKLLPANLALGVYEAPTPYKRLMSPRLIKWAVDTKRFHFTKDTCCNIDQIAEKLAISKDTTLRFYNAHTATVLPSLKLGGNGFSGVGSNLVPQLYAWLCKNHATHPDLAEKLQQFLIKTAPVVDISYPQCAEAYMRQYGIPITPLSRHVPDTLTQAHIDQFPAFHASVTEWEQTLKIPSPFALIK